MSMTIARDRSDDARVRLPRLAFAASALWAAWWYARAGQGSGLLAFAAVLCVASVATRRSLRATR